MFKNTRKGSSTNTTIGMVRRGDSTSPESAPSDTKPWYSQIPQLVSTDQSVSSGSPGFPPNDVNLESSSGNPQKIKINDGSSETTAKSVLSDTSASVPVSCTTVTTTVIPVASSEIP